MERRFLSNRGCARQSSILHHEIVLDLRIHVVEHTQNLVARIALCWHLARLADQIERRADVDLVRRARRDCVM
jgi:hypothetical protein